MPKYLIERTFPGANKLTKADLHAIAQKSCAVRNTLDDPASYQWLESHAVGDRIFCLHIAPDAETVREHSRRAGFPIDRVTEIAATFSPADAADPQPATA